MKKTIFTFGLALIVLSVKAQWTDNGNNLTTYDNVGIGTTAPSDKLHVKGPDLWLKLEDSNSNSYATTNAGIQFNNSYATVGQIFQTGQNMVIESRGGTSSLSFKTNALERLRINKDGNIGIGTIAPSDKLHVKGPDLWLKLEDSNSNSYATTNAGIQFNNSYATVGQIFQIGENMVIESRGETSSLSFKTNALERLRINKDGNIGIGTTSTGTHKLAVEGSIGARKVRVEASGWSDFVFENDYQLKSLQEVEKYVLENKHLPEIPSAKEVKRDGIDLGEMDAKLLQKIEELTLYLIEQNKQNQAQQARIEQLEQELKALKDK